MRIIKISQYNMKLINKELKKRIQAIIYFSKNVKYPYKLKIFKLLYLLDFIHFKQTGRPVTDLEYYAYPKGPVPQEFHRQMQEDKLPAEIIDSLNIVHEKDDLTGEDKFIRFVPKAKLNLKVFTKREQKILENLALIFKEANSEDMSEISHLKNEPWDKTKKSIGLYQKIDIFLALDDEKTVDAETAQEILDTIGQIRQNFL